MKQTKWTSEPTATINTRHIRHINDENGDVIADVRYGKRKGEEISQEENLLNCKLLTAAPELLNASQKASELLTEGLSKYADGKHIDFKSLAGFAIELLKPAISKATK